MNFLNEVLYRLIQIVKEHKGDKRVFIGRSEIFRNLFSEWHDKGELRLEDLPQEEKLKLWEESKILCPDDRIRFCKAVRFYETF